MAARWSAALGADHELELGVAETSGMVVSIALEFSLGVHGAETGGVEQLLLDLGRMVLDLGADPRLELDRSGSSEVVAVLALGLRLGVRAGSFVPCCWPVLRQSCVHHAFIC